MHYHGFEFRSPQQATLFFLKAILISLCVGFGAISALIIATLPGSVFAHHWLIITVVIGTAICGMVFSIFFIWAAGGMRDIVQSPKRDAPQLRNKVIGGISTATLLFAFGMLLWQRPPGDMANTAPGADLAIAKKCAEVATLERHLFQSDERAAMAQCLIQYDHHYATILRQSSASKT